MKLNFKLLSVFLLLVLVICSELANCSQKNYESCSKNDDCASKYCKKSVCQQRKCRNDKACIKAGLTDHYCRRRRIKIFSSEW